MRFIGFMEIDNIVYEYFPENEQIYKQKDKRNMFIRMFNYYVEEEFKIGKDVYGDFSKNLLKTFIDKAVSLMPKRSLIKKETVTKTTFTLDLVSTIIINSFLNKNKLNISRQKPNIAAAGFIQMFMKNGQFELMLDLEDMFLTLVYERIKIVNRDKNIILGDKTIEIIDPKGIAAPTLVIPQYRNIDTNMEKLDLSINNDISNAKNLIEKKEHQQIFLVYPKNNRFSKHIEIKFDDYNLKEDGYRVKMIPYSFSFCIKHRKKRRHQWQ